MGRKNSFLPEAVQKDKQFLKLKHKNLIEWKDESSQSVEMFDLIEFLKKDPISQRVAKETDLSPEIFLDHKLIGVVQINQILKLHVESEYHDYLYLISDSEFKDIYISVERVAPAFWYHYTNRKTFLDQFDQIVDAYDKKTYELNYPRKMRAFIGTEQMLNLNFNEIIDMFIISSHTEILTWGSNWKDHPFRDIYMRQNVNQKEGVQLSKQAMKQSDPSIRTMSIRTAYSKSIMTLEDHDGAYILEISYNPIKTEQIDLINNHLDRQYPTDLPVDTIISCINFPFVNHIGLIKLKPITTYNFIMASLVANNLTMYQEMIPEVRQIIKDLEEGRDHNDNEYSEQKKEMLCSFLEELETKTTLEHILKDESVEKFIGQKIINLRARNQTFGEVKNELFEMLEHKLIQLRLRNDQDFKEELAKIISGILKFGV